MAFMAELLPGADPGAAVGAKGPVVLRQLQTGPARPAEQVISLHRLPAVGTFRHMHSNLIKIIVIFNISFYGFNFKDRKKGPLAAALESGIPGKT
jgi:hypothetical protein